VFWHNSSKTGTGVPNWCSCVCVVQTTLYSNQEAACDVTRTLVYMFMHTCCCHTRSQTQEHHSSTQLPSITTTPQQVQLKSPSLPQPAWGAFTILFLQLLSCQHGMAYNIPA